VQVIDIDTQWSSMLCLLAAAANKIQNSVDMTMTMGAGQTTEWLRDRKRIGSDFG
jgi:hypothetical protein